MGHYNAINTQFMGKIMSCKKTRINLTVTEGINEWLIAESVRQDRSRNSMIIACIKNYMRENRADKNSKTKK